MLATLLIGISAAMAALARWLGPTAAYPAAALAALADAHAAVAALASLAATTAPTLTPGEAVLGMLLAIGANTGMRVVVAALSGGARYTRGVAAALVGSLLAALALWLGA
jgi:uncharacterized membrane protein (DUF4010 family)